MCGRRRQYVEREGEKVRREKGKVVLFTWMSPWFGLAGFSADIYILWIWESPGPLVLSQDI